MISFSSIIKENLAIHAYCLGVDAFYEKGSNPFEEDTEEFKEWIDGHLDAAFLKGDLNAKDDI